MRKPDWRLVFALAPGVLGASCLRCGDDPLPITPVAAEAALVGLRPHVRLPATSRVERLEVRDAQAYVDERGLHEMVPTLPLPTTKEDDQRITLWLKLPGDASIATALDERGHPILRLPDGAEADRIEYRRCSTEPDCWTVQDIRGTRFGPDGVERVHVLLPRTMEPQSPLAGVEWPRHDEQASREATEKLTEILVSSGAAGTATDLDFTFVDRFRRLNHCIICHEANQAPASTAAQVPRGPTDGKGLYGPLAVLLDELPVSASRSRDRNHDDRFVTVRCRSGKAQLVSDGEARRYACNDGSAPIGRRDVRQALSARDPYTTRLCSSRQYLQAYLDAVGRRVFADAFRACGIAP